MHERSKAKENFDEKNKIYVNSDDLVFGITPKTKSNGHNYLAWTGNKLQLLETARDFKTKKAYEGVSLESVKNK